MPSEEEAALVVPSEAEVVEVCRSIKASKPEYGVKRVFETLKKMRPEWRVNSRRVQKVMRKFPAAKEESSPLTTSPLRAPTVYPEDCVCLRRKGSRFGWVLRAAGVLGGEEDDDTDDEEDESTALENGTARVQWLDRYDPAVENVEELVCVDRPFAVGDVVAKATDPTGTLGTITKVQSKADVKVLYAGKNETRDASGRTTSPSSSRNSRTSIKTRSVLRDIESEFLRPAGTIRSGDPVVHAKFHKWVGRVVSASYDITVRPQGSKKGSVVFKNVNDDDGSSNVEPCGDADLGFDELCPYFPGQRLSASASCWRRALKKSGSSQKRFQRRRNGLVEKVELSMVRVQWIAFGSGARVEPPPAACEPKDLIFMHRFCMATRVGDHVLGSSEHLRGFPSDACGQVVKTQTLCEVQWNQTQVEENVASLSLVPRQQLGDHDFLPHDFVVHAEEGHDIGVVQKVDSRERTVSVKWENNKVEVLSAYELALHAQYNMNAGEIVIKLEPGAGIVSQEDAEDDDDGGLSKTEAQNIAKAIAESLKEPTTQEPTTVQEPPTEITENKKWLGQVKGLADGRVRVQWLDGERSHMHPSQLLAIPDAASLYETDDESSDGSEEEEEDDESYYFEDGEEEECEKNQGPQGIMAAIASVIRRTQGETPPLPKEEEESSGNAEEDGGEASFCVVESDPPGDHHFLGSPPQQVPLKATRQLWQQLDRNLPAGISVRVFEKRSDLLRVLIVGPKETPYAELFFVFDVQLAADYPKEPPSVYYHARGVKERLNPNLYENGKVCLSLLGTWSGPGWDPDQSTLLQVLVSIQGLVLVDKPYYNEPGNEKHENTIEGDHHSHLYNESATLLAVKTSISVLKQPPKPLNSVIAKHLSSKPFQELLQKLENQLSSPPPPPSDNNTSILPPSEGYKRVMKRLLPQLKTAVEHFLRQHNTQSS